MKKNFTIIGKAGGGSSATGTVRYDVEQQLTTEEKKQALDNLGVDLSAQLKREIVDELPTVGEDNVIYMVIRAEAEEQNVYDEYMYINGQWDKIGSTETKGLEVFDLAVRSKEEVIALRNDILAGEAISYDLRYNSQQLTLKSKGSSTTDTTFHRYLNSISTSSRFSVKNQEIRIAPDGRVYDFSPDLFSLYKKTITVKQGVNTKGSFISLDTDSSTAQTIQLDTVPSKLSELENDSGFLTEHQELKTINGESIIGTGDLEIKGFSGDYNDLTNKPTILNHWFGTQEEYDAIAVKDENTIYHIEGGGIDLDNYYTKAEVDTVINTLEGEINTKTTMTDVEAKGYTTHDELSAVENKIPTNTEVWTFVLADGTEITKEIYVK